jgi:predicted branched-subunit amino acid permease
VLSLKQSLQLGIRSSRSYFISTFLFGLMFGIAAASAGVHYWHTLFMSAAVFSASAQFAALEFWLEPLPLGTIALSVFLVSTRNILLGMAMTHHFDGHSVGRRMAWLFLLNDPGVVTALSLDKSVDRLGYITGYGISLMLAWMISTWTGMAMADLFARSNMGSLEFAGPMVMATMMVLFAKGTGASPLPWIVSGVVALVLFEIGTSAYLILPLAVTSGVILALNQGGKDRG